MLTDSVSKITGRCRQNFDRFFSVNIFAALCLKKWSPFSWFHEFMSPIGQIAKIIMTSSNGNIFRVTGHLCGAVTPNFDVFFDLRPKKLLSKQSWGWWFETPSRPLWRHRNVGTSMHVRFGWTREWRDCMGRVWHYLKDISWPSDKP